MIHLDANILIQLPKLLQNGHHLTARIGAGGRAATSALAWYEYMNGPVSPQDAALVLRFIEKRIVAIDQPQAELASSLFNQAGRKRLHKTDAVIAATAIHAGAELLTYNVEDFKPFVAMGLKLLPA